MAFKKVAPGGQNADRTIRLGGEGNETFIEGHFLGSKTFKDKLNPEKMGSLHYFMVENEIVGVWGRTRLDKALTSRLIGHLVRVQFTGMIKSKKKGYSPSYGFDIEHDPENTIDTSDFNFGGSSVDEGQQEEDEIVAEPVKQIVKPAGSSLGKLTAALRK